MDSTVQSLLYPNSDEHLWDILYRIFYRPYLILFQDFDIEELEGTVDNSIRRPIQYIDNSLHRPMTNLFDLIFDTGLRLCLFVDLQLTFVSARNVHTNKTHTAGYLLSKNIHGNNPGVSNSVT